MIESAASDIDVDDLMARLRKRVSDLRNRPDDAGLPFGALSLRTNVFTNMMEAHANIADQKLQIRTQWPANVGCRFPFNFEIVRSSSLRLFAFLFKDQRHVNEALVAACRDQIGLNRHLTEQLQTLRSEIEALASHRGRGAGGDKAN